jgi:hypothetical protein
MSFSFECFIAHEDDVILEDGVYKSMPSICIDGIPARYVFDGQTSYDFIEPACELPLTYWGRGDSEEEAICACHQVCTLVNRMGGLDAMTANRNAFAAIMGNKRK